MSGIEVQELERRIVGEVLAVVGWSAGGPFGRALGRAISYAVRRFAEVAATCDRLVAKQGFVVAGRWTFSQFATDLQVEGVERVPSAGPVVIASNHPGAVDALALVVGSGRDDLKIVAWPMPFLEYLPHVSSHLICVSDDKRQRARAVREGIRHLAHGGALLLFARGRLEPDPATMPGAGEELPHWSQSSELFLRAVPEASVVPTIVSGVLARKYVRHPLTWVRRGRLARHRVAMILQFIQQMRGKRVPLVPYVTFGAPLRGDTGREDLFAALLYSSRVLLRAHVARWAEREALGATVRGDRSHPTA